MRNSRIEAHPTSGAVGPRFWNRFVRRSQGFGRRGIARSFQRVRRHFLPRAESFPGAAYRVRASDSGRSTSTGSSRSRRAIADRRSAQGAEPKPNIGGGWHTDHSYDQVPALGSILFAREVPPFGGDTLFASMSHAYEALSDGLKRTLEQLRAVHSSRHVFGAASRYAKESGDRLGNTADATQDAIHPVVVVIRKPAGRRSTSTRASPFTSRGGLRPKSKPLLDFLYAHAARPEFQTRFRWREGSIAFWDNRATWHFAINDYHGERRLMHRITLEGVPLE